MAAPHRIQLRDRSAARRKKRDADQVDVLERHASQEPSPERLSASGQLLKCSGPHGGLTTPNAQPLRCDITKASQWKRLAAL